MTKIISIKDIAKKYGTTFKFTQTENIVDHDYVRKLRLKLNYTQSYFAQVIGVTKKTIEKWEQGRNPVTGAAAALLYIINENPEVLNLLVYDESKYYQIEDTSKTSSNFELLTNVNNTKKDDKQALKNAYCAA